MTTNLVNKVLIKAYNLRQPPKGLVFHNDWGSQYTRKQHRKLLAGYGLRANMGDVGACWDNAVVERFFGSLKHDRVFKIAQPTRERMKKDVGDYIRYYNLERLHTANENQSPINYENSLKKVSGLEVTRTHQLSTLLPSPTSTINNAYHHVLNRYFKSLKKRYIVSGNDDICGESAVSH